MPIEMLGKRMHELPRGMALAAYCRGPYCCLAHEAAAILEASGRRLQVIPSGVMEWSSRGAELESASPRNPRKSRRDAASERRPESDGSLTKDIMTKSRRLNKDGGFFLWESGNFRVRSSRA